MYLALGDSIATGTLHNFARVTSYTEYLYHMLKRRGRRTRMVSLARDGDTSRELLYRLGQPWFQSWVRRAGRGAEGQRLQPSFEICETAGAYRVVPTVQNGVQTSAGTPQTP